MESNARDRLTDFQTRWRDLDEAHLEIMEDLKTYLRGEGRVILYRPNERGDQLDARAAIGLSTPGVIDGEEDLVKLRAVSLAAEGSSVALAFRQRNYQTDNEEVAVPLLFEEEGLGVIWVAGPLTNDTIQEELAASLLRLGREMALVLRSGQVSQDLSSGSVNADDLLDIH